VSFSIIRSDGVFGLKDVPPRAKINIPLVLKKLKRFSNSEVKSKNKHQIGSVSNLFAEKDSQIQIILIPKVSSEKGNIFQLVFDQGYYLWR
jgi:hypothetical protein